METYAELTPLVPFDHDSMIDEVEALLRGHAFGADIDAVLAEGSGDGFSGELLPLSIDLHVPLLPPELPSTAEFFEYTAPSPLLFGEEAQTFPSPLLLDEAETAPSPLLIEEAERAPSPLPSREEEQTAPSPLPSTEEAQTVPSPEPSTDQAVVTAPAKPRFVFAFSFRCVHCAKQFHSMDRLITHRKRAHRRTCITCCKKERDAELAKKGYVCTFCGKPFEFQSRLRAHIAKHLDSMPKVCSVCQKRFASDSALETHMRIHTGSKPFKCDVCEKAFQQKSYLKIHMRTHSKNKQFECDLCGKKFNFKSQLTVHKKSSVHRDKRPIDCPVCTRDFTTKNDLRKHIEKFHKNVSCQQVDEVLDEMELKYEIKEDFEM